MATHKIYAHVVSAAFNKEIDVDSDTFKAMLLTSSYTPDQDNHDYKNDLTNELSATGYTAGGKAITSFGLTYTSGTNKWKFAGDSLVWTGFTGTFRYTVIVDSTPSTDATRPLVSYIDWGSDQTVTAGTLTINWDAAGIATLEIS